MYMFVLGVLFGSGLVLAYREIEFQIWLRSQRRKTTAPPQSDTCGCHFSWDDHEAYMLRGTTIPKADW